MQTPAVVDTITLSSVGGISSGNNVFVEVAITSLNSGENGGVSGFLNDGNSGISSQVQYEVVNLFSQPTDLNNYEGAMGGYVDSRTGFGAAAGYLLENPPFTSGVPKICALDIEKYVIGGITYDTRTISAEADISYNHAGDFVSGFECHIGGESGSFGKGGGRGGYDIRYRRNPIRI